MSLIVYSLSEQYLRYKLHSYIKYIVSRKNCQLK